MNPNAVPTVTIDELPANAVLLDVREDYEWAAGHIDGALHVAMNDIPGRVNSEPARFESADPIVVVCKMGGRSAQVTGWLNRNGISAVNLDGGMLAWATAGRPMVSDDASTPHVA